MAGQACPSGGIAALLAQAAARLTAAGVDAPRASAELLAAKAFGLTRLQLITQARDCPDPAALAEFEALVARRAAGEPVAYLLGEKEFFGLNFRVTPDVLIPRPETELLVEQAQGLFAPDFPLRFADFGTGSGALAVTLAQVFPQSRGVAVDLSEAALEVARGNARAHGVADRLDFRLADFTALMLPAASLDLVVANPPYVTEAEYAALDREVRGFEPGTALVSPDEGLAHIRGLAPVAACALKPGGALLCEFGADQGRAVLELFSDPALGFTRATILRDYAGLDRALFALRAAA